MRKRLDWLSHHITLGVCAICCGLYFGAFVEAHAAAEKRLLEKAHFVEAEINCLGSIAFHEARNQRRGSRRLLMMVMIARRDDPQGRWPKTICGNAVNGEISQVSKEIPLNSLEAAALRDNFALAREVYAEAWKEQLLPRGWECVRFFRLSDAELAKLSETQLRKLGIVSGKGMRFFEGLVPVQTHGSITFYKHPTACTPLPTT